MRPAKKYQFIKLPQDVYYIDRLPVALQAWPDLTFCNSGKHPDYACLLRISGV